MLFSLISSFYLLDYWCLFYSLLNVVVLNQGLYSSHQVYFWKCEMGILEPGKLNILQWTVTQCKIMLPKMFLLRSSVINWSFTGQRKSCLSFETFLLHFNSKLTINFTSNLILNHLLLHCLYFNFSYVCLIFLIKLCYLRSRDHILSIFIFFNIHHCLCIQEAIIGWFLFLLHRAKYWAHNRYSLNICLNQRGKERKGNEVGNYSF